MPHAIRYGLSNKRADIAKSFWNTTMESYPINPGDTLERQEGKVDTVVFKALISTDSDGDKKTTKIGFDGIADGAKGSALIRDIQESRAKEQQ